MRNGNLPHPLWFERPDGTLTAVGHTQPQAVAGHVILNTAGQYSQLVTGRHGRLEYWRIPPENLSHFGLRVGPVI